MLLNTLSGQRFQRLAVTSIHSGANFVWVKSSGSLSTLITLTCLTY